MRISKGLEKDSLDIKSVSLPDFKSCMLAALRSLLPKIWSTQHEVAWAWLWENVERVLRRTMGLPPKWERALTKVITSLDEKTLHTLRWDIYRGFFEACPDG